MTDTLTTRWPTLLDGRMLVLRTCEADTTYRCGSTGALEAVRS